jgi:hypothetical protein
MRTTINMPDRLHEIVSSLAHHTGRTYSQTLAELVERGLSAPVAGTKPKQGFRIDPRTGLPVTSSSRIITPEDVARLEDEI